MLIPEAAQLVIQAAAMAEGGEVFVLDMGESVKIMQLARSMIELAGLTVKNEENPDGDIEIRITGLKDDETLRGTSNRNRHPTNAPPADHAEQGVQFAASRTGRADARDRPRTRRNRPKADVVLKLAMAQ